jgi:hypothetical protein
MTECLKLTGHDSAEKRAGYRLVRLDTGDDVPGSLISCASEETGLCLMQMSDGSSQIHDFGPNGLRIISARR